MILRVAPCRTNHVAGIEPVNMCICLGCCRRAHQLTQKKKKKKRESEGERERERMSECCLEIKSKGKLGPVTDKTLGAQWGQRAVVAWGGIVDPLFDFDARDRDVISIDFDKKSKS